MALNISPDTEAKLAARAREQGLSVEALIEQLMNERDTGSRISKAEAPELPAWHLGAAGRLRRRDIYDDFR